MRSGGGAFVRRAFIGLVLGSSWLVASAPVFAQTATAPTPRIVIYPGDIIHDDMLVDMPVDEVVANGRSAVQRRSSLIGKMARRTLLPGHAIPLSAVTNPRLVTNGSEVGLVYSEGGLTITTSGAALQDGGLGDIVKVRNSDSGVTVTGVVQPDGTVRIRGG